MLVSLEKVPQVVEELRHEKALGVDTETTGLHFWRDKLFSIIISSLSSTYYFNFLKYPEEESVKDKFVLGPGAIELLKPLFDTTSIVWFAHNAKFDIHMLKKSGLAIAGDIHCTEVGARLVYNQHRSYSLDSVATRAGEAKEDAVKKYIVDNKLFTKKMIAGKEFKHLHYDKVPFSLMYTYGLTDGQLALDLGLGQIKELRGYCAQTPTHEEPIRSVYNTERKVTKVLAAMEWEGIRIDPAYCKAAIKYEELREVEAKREFSRLTDMPFVDSRKTFVPAFEKLGLEYGRTEKGNPSFKDDMLPNNPLGECIRAFRNSRKNVSTYYGNFLYYRDSNDRIHCNIRQSGTSTGRLSCAEPNLQNLPKNEDKEKPYLVRRAFIPCSPDYTFFMIDWDQMEYRLLLDLAGEMDVIEAIMGGLDVHQATADAMGVSRTHAKTLNFMLLYGGGAQKLANALDISLVEAKIMKEKYFSSLPKVAQACTTWRNEARQIGRIRNHAGRICYFPDRDKDYVAPNHKIQGGCADIVKNAMVECYEYMQNSNVKSKILLQVHDELLFSIHKDEYWLVPELHHIMERSYQFKHLPLTCSIDYSNKSWADKEPWHNDSMVQVR